MFFFLYKSQNERIYYVKELILKQLHPPFPTKFRHHLIDKPLKSSLHIYILITIR